MARKRRLGKLAPRYSFALNPYPEVRWSGCPRCRQPMHARKFPLLIFVEENTFLNLGLTCRYCTRCEFIIAHQHELEEELFLVFSRRAPDAIGNPYQVLGVVDRKTWQASLSTPLDLDEMLRHTADIKRHYTLDDPRPRWVYTGGERKP